MLDILFFFFIFIAFLDLRLFRGYDAGLFRRVFHLPKKVILFFLCGLDLVLLSPAGRWENAFLFVLISVVPWYLLRRDQFLKLSSLNKPDPVNVDQKQRALIWYSDALGVILWWFFCIFTTAFVFKRIGGLFFDFSSELLPLIIVTFLSLMIMLALIYRASKKFPGKDFLTNVGLRQGGRPRFKIIFIPTVVGLVFAFLSASIIVAREIQPETPLSEILESAPSVPAVIIFLVLAVLLAPLFEEIIFRGYFYYVLSQRKGPVFAIYVVALSFGLLHVDQYWGDWLAVGMVMALGFVLTLLRAWTGSTLASAVTHYVYNAGVTILTLILFSFSNPSYFEYKMNMHTLDFPAKEELLQKGLAKQPQSSEIRYDLAVLYTQENAQLEEALQFIEGALERHPDEPGYLDTKAEILCKLGRLSEALKIREELLERKISQKMKDHQRDKIRQMQSLP